MVVRRLIATLAACLALAGCEEGERSAPAAHLPPVVFGINAQALEPLANAGRTAELERQLRSLSSLGVDFARANFDWAIAQPRPPAAGPAHLRPAPTDAWVAALARERLRWQVTAIGAPTPAWARDRGAERAGCGDRSPPARPRDFAKLVAQVARRYGRHGRFWRRHPGLPYEPVLQYEVWNEPNFDAFWCPSPDPESYGRIYAAVRDAVHDVDPRAAVVFGGLAAFGLEPVSPEAARVQMPAGEFLRRALAAAPGPRPRVDVLAVHPYGQTPAEALAALAWFRTLADRAGLEGVPLSVNEVGWRTRGEGTAPKAREALRAKNVAELIPAIARSQCEVSEVALFAWSSRERDPADPEDWYGIADPASGEPYPTAEAYARAVSRLGEGDLPGGSEGALGPACAG